MNYSSVPHFFANYFTILRRGKPHLQKICRAASLYNTGDAISRFCRDHLHAENCIIIINLRLLLLLLVWWEENGRLNCISVAVVEGGPPSCLFGYHTRWADDAADKDDITGNSSWEWHVRNWRWNSNLLFYFVLGQILWWKFKKKKINWEWITETEWRFYLYSQLRSPSISPVLRKLVWKFKICERHNIPMGMLGGDICIQKEENAP